MTRKNIHVHTSYLHEVFYPNIFRKKVKTATLKVKSFKEKNGIDAIAFTGTSGAALAYPVAYNLNLGLINVRKLTERSHFTRGDYGPVEGFLSSKKYVIIDDFIESGKTIKYILSNVKKAQKAQFMSPASCSAILLYGSTDDARHFNGIPLFHFGSETELNNLK